MSAPWWRDPTAWGGLLTAVTLGSGIMLGALRGLVRREIATHEALDDQRFKALSAEVMATEHAASEHRVVISGKLDVIGNDITWIKREIGNGNGRRA